MNSWLKTTLLIAAVLALSGCPTQGGGTADSLPDSSLTETSWVPTGTLMAGNGESYTPGGNSGAVWARANPVGVCVDAEEGTVPMGEFYSTVGVDTIPSFVLATTPCGDGRSVMDSSRVQGIVLANGFGAYRTWQVYEGALYFPWNYSELSGAWSGSRVLAVCGKKLSAATNRESAMVIVGIDGQPRVRLYTWSEETSGVFFERFSVTRVDASSGTSFVSPAALIEFTPRAVLDSETGATHSGKITYQYRGKIDRVEFPSCFLVP